jgi:Reverse transcriptase (RNA-dependent DNA polymerase)
MKQGKDYFDIHASVVKSTIIRILLSLAAALGMIVELADVETAYLNTALRKFIHTKQPLYFELKDCMKYVLLLKQHYMDFHNLVSNGQQLFTLHLKPLDSIALLTMIISILTAAIPTFPTSTQQQSSLLCTLTISSLLARINRQLTQ